MVKAEAYLYVFRNDISISSGLRSKRNNFVFSFNVIFSGGPAAACCGIMIHFFGNDTQKKTCLRIDCFHCGNIFNKTRRCCRWLAVAFYIQT